jgi:hypothetical protein
MRNKILAVTGALLAAVLMAPNHEALARGGGHGGGGFHGGGFGGGFHAGAFGGGFRGGGFRGGELHQFAGGFHRGHFGRERFGRGFGLDGYYGSYPYNYGCDIYGYQQDECSY